MNNLPQRLKYYRRQIGLTQEATADALGIRSQNYAKYESGERTPKDDKLIALAKLFHVSFDALYTGVERSLTDLLRAHLQRAVLGEYDGFDAFESDMSMDEGYGVVSACFEKWDSIIQTQADIFYSVYICDPDLQTLIELYRMCQAVESDGDSAKPLILSDGRMPLHIPKAYKLAFCIAVSRYLAETDPDIIWQEADKLSDTRQFSPLQYFAVKVFVPFLAYIADAVEFIADNSYMGDFEYTFLYDAITPPDDDTSNR